MSDWVWTDERQEALIRMRGDGKSYAVIAAFFGVTRNTVGGKCHRLGLTNVDKVRTKALTNWKKVQANLKKKLEKVEDRILALGGKP
jgi:hypothetical protein